MEGEKEMKFYCTNKQLGVTPFVVMTYRFDNGERALHDPEVVVEMERLKLRVVERDEFMAYIEDSSTTAGKVGDSCLAAFGNEVPDPESETHFKGVPYLEDGDLKVISSLFFTM